MIKILGITLLLVLLNACKSDDDEVAIMNNVPAIQDVEHNLTAQFFAEIGLHVLTMEASDIDGNALVYSIVSQTPSGAITINPNNGEIYVADLDAFDNDQNLQIVATIQVTDGSASNTAELIINIHCGNC